jgi:hypothetical protein
MRKSAGVILVVGVHAVWLVSAQAVVIFDDNFTNGLPYSNNGTGGDWSDISQPAGIPRAPHSESGGAVTIQDGVGPFAIGQLRTNDGFQWGQQVDIWLNDVQITAGIDSQDRGAGLDWEGYATFSLFDSANNEFGANALNNDGLAGMHIEVGKAKDDVDWGFVVRIAGPSNGSDVAIASGVFDTPIGPASPLKSSITTTASGYFFLNFNRSYNGGNSAAVFGNSRGFSGATLGPTFDVGIGAQGVDRSDAVAFYDRVTTIEFDVTSADYNNNGTVDAADYVLWRNTLGQSGFGLPADGSRNGEVDLDDYTIWRGRFGQVMTQGLLVEAIPEPSTLWLVSLAGFVAIASRRRKKPA